MRKSFPRLGLQSPCTTSGLNDRSYGGHISQAAAFCHPRNRRSNLSAPFPPRARSTSHDRAATARSDCLSAGNRILGPQWRCAPVAYGAGASPRCRASAQASAFAQQLIIGSMRLSRFFLPVLRETPKEAEVVSHQLMLRAGLVRQASAGIYSWLPLGYRVLKKIEQIVREVQDRSGAMQMLMPTIQSADLW